VTGGLTRRARLTHGDLDGRDRGDPAPHREGQIGRTFARYAMLLAPFLHAWAYVDAQTHGSKAVLKGGSTIDLGVVRPHTQTKFTFQVSNEGRGPLSIDSVKAACGCLRVELSQSSVPVGATCTATATLTPDILRGDAERVIILETNDPSSRQLQVKIRFRVVPLVDWEPKRLYLRGKRPDEITGIIRVFPGERPVGLLRAVGDPSWLVPTVLPTREESGAALVRVALGPQAAEGNQEGLVSISTDATDANKIEVPVHLYLEPALSMHPSSLFFGFVAQGQKKELTVTGRHREGGRVQLVSATSTDARVSCVVGRDGSVAVVLKADPPAGKVAGNVALTISAPFQQEVLVPFVGFVQGP